MAAPLLKAIDDGQQVQGWLKLQHDLSKPGEAFGDVIPAVGDEVCVVEGIGEVVAVSAALGDDVVGFLCAGGIEVNTLGLDCALGR